MLIYLFLTQRGKTRNTPLKLRASRQMVLVTLLMGVLVGGCTPIATPQLAATVTQMPHGTPSIRPETILGTPTRLISEAPTLAVSMTPSLAPTSTEVPTTTPVPVQTQQPFREDSQLIAFTSLQDGYPAVYTIDISKGFLGRLTPDSVSGFRPQWSPDGRMLGFLSVDENEDKQLLVLDVQQNRLLGAEISHVTSFSWSPDSQLVVFASNELTPGNRYRTYTMSITNLQPQVLYESDVVALDVQWSPTSNQILNLALFERIQAKFAYILDLTGNAKELPLKGSPGYVDWDPTGQQIAYDNTFFPAFDQREIRVIRVDGVDDRPVTEADHFTHDPQWSPNGEMVAYQGYTEDTNPVIYMKNLSSNETIQVSSSDMNSQYPSWSPNGKYIAFLVETDNVAEIGYALYIFSIETGKVTKLVNEFVAAYRPDWRP